MQGQALARGAKHYLLFLVRAALFPLAWVWALAVARRHAETDPQGRTKVLAAIAAGVVLAGGAYFLLAGFASNATAGMYDELDTRLAVASGESEYQDQVAQVGAKQIQIDVLSGRLAAAEAAGDQDNATVFAESLATARAEHAMHSLKAQRLQRNHAFYERLSPVVAAQDDDAVKQMVAAFAAETAASTYEDPSFQPPISFSAGGLQKQSDRAFAIKDKAQADMGAWMQWLLLPGLVGVFFAPLVLVLGGILSNAWERSDTVGFKPYPGGAMAAFLFLGAFGVPALFFAAWTFWDMDIRSVEGQISL